MSRVPYFAFYPADFMNGVRGLTAQEVGVYTMILCRIYEESGPVEYHPRRLSTYCGMREATFVSVVDKLVDLDKLQLVDGRLFNRRASDEIQKRADGLKIASKAGKASAEKRQQKQRMNATPVDAAFNHTDTDTEEDISSYEEIVIRAVDDVSEAVAGYNDAATRNAWPSVQKMTAARRKALRARLADCGGLDGWRCAIGKAEASDFLCGRTAKPWTGFGFDWFTKPANFTKLMEGNYDNRAGQNFASDNSSAFLRSVARAAGSF